MHVLLDFHRKKLGSEHHTHFAIPLTDAQFFVGEVGQECFYRATTLSPTKYCQRLRKVFTVKIGDITVISPVKLGGLPQRGIPREKKRIQDRRCCLREAFYQA